MLKLLLKFVCGVCVCVLKLYLKCVCVEIVIEMRVLKLYSKCVCVETVIFEIDI